ncbi:hypothetical protein ACOMHN_065656 [Nucella lapillus]
MTLELWHMASYLILYSSHHLCEDLLHMASYLILYSRHHLCEDLLHMASYLILYSSHHLCEDLLCYTRHIFQQELSCVLVANFIKEKQLEQQQAKLAPPGQTGPSRPYWPLQAKLPPPGHTGPSRPNWPLQAKLAPPGHTGPSRPNWPLQAILAPPGQTGPSRPYWPLQAKLAPPGQTGPSRPYWPLQAKLPPPGHTGPSRPNCPLQAKLAPPGHTGPSRPNCPSRPYWPLQAKLPPPGHTGPSRPNCPLQAILAPPGHTGPSRPNCPLQAKLAPPGHTGPSRPNCPLQAKLPPPLPGKVRPKASHIAGKLNILADALSRSKAVLSTEWTLNSQLLDVVWTTWYRPMVDLFATRFNHQLPTFVSPVPDPLAWATDALSIPWRGILGNSSIFDKKKLDDPTQLILMFKVTDLVGIVSLLYGMLLHSGVPLRRDMAPCELSVQTLAITRALGEEGMTLEFRHMASYLILYSRHHLCEDLLHMASYLILYTTCVRTCYTRSSSAWDISPCSILIIRLCCSSCVPCPSSNSATPASPLFSSPPSSPAVTTTTPTDASSNRSSAVCSSPTSSRHILEQELSCVLLANFIKELLRLKRAYTQLHRQYNDTPTLPVTTTTMLNNRR